MPSSRRVSPRAVALAALTVMVWSLAAWGGESPAPPTHAGFVRSHLWQWSGEWLDSLGVRSFGTAAPADGGAAHRWLATALEHHRLQRGGTASPTASPRLAYDVTRWQLTLRELGKDESGRRPVERRLEIVVGLSRFIDPPDRSEGHRFHEVTADTLDAGILSSLTDPTDTFLQPEIALAPSRRWIEPAAVATVVGVLTVLFFSVR